MDPAQPMAGTVTVVLGDVAGSTRLWQSAPEDMAAASRRLMVILDGLVEAHGGHRPREQGEGDNLVATFRVAADAAAFTLALDDALTAEPWPGGLTVAMRLGMHTGDVEWDDQTGYLGPTFNRCARLRDLGHAHMILLSQATRDIVADALPADVRIRDLGSHQLRDLSRAEHVYQLLSDDDQREFPPLKSVSSLPNNLPVPVTSLIGREEEVPAIARLLLDHRLVTLTGAGGSGKTRLAQHVASEALQYAADGAWWVDLMPVTDDERVPVVIGEAAGIPDITAGPRAAATLAAGLGDKRMLLVTDNCEHLIDAVAETIELLLERCPNVRVLATSRETLDVPGEHAVRVRPLELTTEDHPTLDDLVAGAATRLFLERATSLDPGSLDAEGCRAVAAICRRLDGMPLAIELAAARTRLLSVTEIESGLDDRFALLTASRRGRRAGARQRTLEASIAWSYDLLEDDEQSMLCRLAVFPSTFDLDGARDVGAGGNAARALDLLTALVDKSLVTVRPAEDGRRYRLLESIRHYGLERLRDRGDAEIARNAHLDHTLARIRSLGKNRTTFDGAIGEILDPDPALLEDIRAADAWGHACGRVSDVITLHWLRYLTPILRGTYHDELVSVRELLDHPDLDLVHNARAHTLVVSYLASANRHEEALALADRAIELGHLVAAEGHGDLPVMGALAGAAHARSWAGGGGSARARECLELARRNADRYGPGVMANTVPFCVLAFAFDGHTEEAFAVAMEGVDAARRAGFVHVGALSANLAAGAAIRIGKPLPMIDDLIERARNAIPDDTPRLHAILASIPGVWSGYQAADPERARRWVAHGFAHAGPKGTATYAMTTAAAAIAAWVARDPEAALKFGTDAARMFAGSSNHWWQTMVAWVIADAKVARRDPGARAAVEDARAALPADGFVVLRQNIEATAARELLSSDPAAALRTALDAVGIARRYGALGLADHPLLALAEALVAAGRYHDAANVHGVATRFRAERGYQNFFAPEYASVEERCREALGSHAFETAHAEGAAMTFQDCVDRFIAEPGSAAERADRPVAGWGALTPAEADVAIKVAEGLTNQQVADALFVSQNTVKTHLKSIYAKLDIQTRAALATEVGRNAEGSHPA